MKNMKVSRKLMVSFLFVTTLAILLAGIGIFSSLSINGNYTHLLEFPMERERAAQSMQLQFTFMRYRAANFAMETENPDIILNTLTPQYDSAYALFIENLEEYEKHNSEDAVHEESARQLNAQTAAQLRSLAAAFDEEVQAVRDAALAGDASGATTVLREVIPLTNEINEALEGMMTRAEGVMAADSASMDASAVTFTTVLIVVAAVCAAISIFLAVYISGMISKPLSLLTAFMKRAGGSGNIMLNDDDAEIIGKYGQYKDEIGQVIGNTATFVKHVIGISESLAHIADGDLTGETELLSDTDVLGLSIKKMTDNLNSMFGGINDASVQVSSGSHQVAEGAQALAAGATEQAASIQELSSSVAEIAHRTKENTRKAEQAAALAHTIKSNAEKGSEQMDEMMQSVKKISEASHAISNVIKAIDDIAFQTNILALNAAVEAARAGAHGKGFAVVAEEVRNLAAKSAEAAKNTESLIADSMEKAATGVKIANDTADSLAGIVSGINQSNALVTEIATASEEQSSGISQINTGIEQVAQVVQQISATAEESAAASEEMSGQSSMLQELIAQFRLKEQGASRRN